MRMEVDHRGRRRPATSRPRRRRLLPPQKMPTCGTSFPACCIVTQRRGARRNSPGTSSHAASRPWLTSLPSKVRSSRSTVHTTATARCRWPRPARRVRSYSAQLLLGVVHSSSSPFFVRRPSFSFPSLPMTFPRSPPIFARQRRKHLCVAVWHDSASPIIARDVTSAHGTGECKISFRPPRDSPIQCFGHVIRR